MTDAPWPDAVEVTVDGVLFSVVHDASQPGAYHYTRLTPPAYGYGFTRRRSDHAPLSLADHLDAVRDFLDQVDPETGYFVDD